jgi:hypothetical protein
MLRRMDKAITVASESASIDGWPTKQEAAKALGVTTKTLEKYVQQGKLAQRMQPQINKPARAVIDPATLEKMLSERSSVTVRERSENPSSVALEPLLEALSRRLPLSELAHKLWLTEDEAVMFSGLGKGYLRKSLEPKPIGPRGAMVYRRRDIEALQPF